MKKLAIVLSVLMVIMLAVPAFAADLNITVDMDTWVEYRKSIDPSALPGVITGGSSIRMRSNISAPNAWIELGYDVTIGRNFTGGWGAGGFDPADLGLGKAHIKLVGPIRTGGNELTVTIGDYHNNLSGRDAWVKGFSVTGIQFGNLSAKVNWVADAAAPSTIVRLDMPGDQLSAYLDIEHALGVASHKGGASLRPNDVMTINGDYWNNGTDYKVSTNIKASDLVSLYGELDNAQNYKVQAGIGTLTQFALQPSFTVGYRKAGADAGFYANSNVVLTPSIRGYAEYDTIGTNLAVVAGTGGMFDNARGDKTVQPFAELTSGDGGWINKQKAQGVVAIYRLNPTAATLQLATRYNVKELLNLGLSDAANVEIRADFINDLVLGAMTRNLVGIVAGTTVSVAGFDNVGLSASYTSDLLAGTSGYKLDASYGAPNGLSFGAGFSSATAGFNGHDGDLWIKASKSISF